MDIDIYIYYIYTIIYIYIYIYINIFSREKNPLTHPRYFFSETLYVTTQRHGLYLQ